MNNFSSTNIDFFQQQAVMLESRVNQTKTFTQLLDIVQEAAKAYHILATYLIAAPGDREQLIELCKKFSQIENDAMIKCYQADFKFSKSIL
jgi:hypothetical protein